jgi:hypothetical protein
MKSPRHFLQYHTEQKEATKSMIFGSLVHCLILTPHLVDSLFAVKPENANKASNANKAILEEFEALTVGKEAVSNEDYKKALQVADTVLKDEHFKTLLTGEKEKPFEFDYLGVKIKGVYDIYNDFAGVSDLKYTADCAPDVFSRKAVRDFKYHLQGAIYTHQNRTSYTILAVDSDLFTNIFTFNEDILEAGFRLFDKWVKIYKQFQEKTAKMPQIWDVGYLAYNPEGFKI